MARSSVLLLLHFTTFTAVACAASAPPTPATLEPRHIFGGEVRLPLTTMREDLLVPQAHTGTGFDLGLRYAGELGDGVLRAELGFGARYLMGQFGAQALDLRHGFGLSHAFTLARGDWSFGLGPALGWQTDIAYFETWDDAHAYWLTDRWVGVAATAWTRLSHCFRITLEAELMLVSLQARPPGKPTHKVDELDAFAFYFSAPQQSSRLAWLADAQRLQLGVELWRSDSRTSVASGWGLGADLRVVHASHPASILILELGLSYTTTWGFR